MGLLRSRGRDWPNRYRNCDWYRQLTAIRPESLLMGYSTGRWGGDTLVVESLGFNDCTWLDYSGNPHRESLRIEQRYRRVDHSHISLDLTHNDPGAYAEPWTLHTNLILAPGIELIGYVRAENEKDGFTLLAVIGRSYDLACRCTRQIRRGLYDPRNTLERVGLLGRITRDSEFSDALGDG